jgi:hypothetical protein
MTGVCGLREPTKTYFAVLILEEAAQSLNIDERTRLVARVIQSLPISVDLEPNVTQLNGRKELRAFGGLKARARVNWPGGCGKG